VSGFSRTVIVVVSGFSRTVIVVVSGFSRTVIVVVSGFSRTLGEVEMKSVAGPLVAAIVLAVAGFGFWLLGKTETRIADMQDRKSVV